jgi:hypothetical protein
MQRHTVRSPYSLIPTLWLHHIIHCINMAVDTSTRAALSGRGEVTRPSLLLEQYGDSVLWTASIRGDTSISISKRIIRRP